MIKRLLVLNTPVSGMNRFLFAALREKGWQLEICDIPLPRLAVLWAYISTFKFNLRHWKDAKNAKLGSYLKNPRIFWQRSRFCARLLRRKWREGDLILQIAGLFAPTQALRQLPGPYAVFLSFTTRLAAKEYPPWAVFPTEETRQTWYNCEEYLYQNASLIVTTNAHAQRNLIGDYQVSPDRISVIGYGVNLDNLVPSDKPRSPKQALYIGYDFERKGGPTILEAFARVHQDDPEAALVIIGPARPDRVPAGVEWLGPVMDRELVADFLRTSAVFVMPSVCEPFGLVFLEAMANQLPCIGSTRDAMPEIITEGETGYLVEPGDSEALAERMQQILGNPQLQQRLGQAASLRVQQHFTWDLVGQRITDAIMAYTEKETG